jgi:hypothetical protein
MFVVCDCVMNIMRRDVCCKYNIIGMGTAGGAAFSHVCCKEGYFHYECDN